MRTIPDTRPSEDKRRPGRNIWLLAMGHFANDTYSGFLAPLQPLLMQQIGYSLTLAGLLTSIQSVATSIMQPVFGLITDRLRRPYLVILGPLVTALFIGTLGLWRSYWGLAAIILLGGLGTAAFHPQAAAMAGQASRTRRGMNMSIFVTGGNAGHALGPLIILTVVTLWGLKYSYLTMIYGIIVVAILWRLLPRELPQAKQGSRIPLRWSMLKSGRFHALFLVWFVVFARAFIVAAFLTFGPIYLTQQHFSLMVAGSANTIFELSGAGGTILGGILSDRIGHKPVILISLLGALPFFWLFLHTSGMVSLVLLGIAGFFLYSSISVNIIMGQELFPEQAGTISSLMMGLAWGLGGLCITPLGAVAERQGIEFALQWMMIILIFAVVAALFIPSARKSSKADTQTLR